jgi:hypothetical protein
MWKSTFIIALVVLLVAPLRGQDESFRIYPEAPSVIVRLSMMTPKFVMEFAPADHFTFTTSFWFNPSFRTQKENGDYYWHGIPTINPRITMEPRYYFTLSYRESKGKRTDYYSGWYIGIPFSMEFPNQMYTLGTVIGFQCTFGRRWYWNAGIGPGVSLENSEFRYRTSGEIGFGFILN